MPGHYAIYSIRRTRDYPRKYYLLALTVGVQWHVNVTSNNVSNEWLEGQPNGGIRMGTWITRMYSWLGVHCLQYESATYKPLWRWIWIAEEGKVNPIRPPIRGVTWPTTNHLHTSSPIVCDMNRDLNINIKYIQNIYNSFNIEYLYMYIIYR